MSPAAVDSLFRYTGRPYFDEIDLQNNRARWYDADSGRFLSTDPSGYEGGGDYNLYRYVSNNPLNYTDPSGLAAQQAAIALASSVSMFGAGLANAAATMIGTSAMVGANSSHWRSVSRAATPSYDPLQINLGSLQSRVDVLPSSSGRVPIPTIDLKAELAKWKSDPPSSFQSAIYAFGGKSGDTTERVLLGGGKVGTTLGVGAGALAAAIPTGGQSLTLGGAFLAGGVAAYNLDQAQATTRSVWTGQNVETVGATLLGGGADYVLGPDSTTGYVLGKGYDYAGLAGFARHLPRLAPVSGGKNLVHMTPAREAIEQSGKLGRPSDLYAGPASNANLSGWRLTGKTGLDASKHYEPIYIPSAAESVFSKPIPIGPFTGWQRAMGTQYAPRGVIDLGTGAFTRTGINRTQAFVLVHRESEFARGLS